MKGYYTGIGYYGYVDGHYVLFSSESDYYESVEADELCSVQQRERLLRIGGSG